jgi:hypothetical protein
MLAHAIRIPLDFWSTEHIQSAIASFGRVLHWEEDYTNLARLQVKARVTDLAAMPKHIIILEAEGFLGSPGLYSVRSFIKTC